MPSAEVCTRKAIKNPIYSFYLWYMLDKKEILDRLISAKPLLAARYPIAALALFGSAARDEAKRGSDIDIFVEFNGKVGSRFFELAHELEALLQNKVDLVTKAAIKDKYLEEIESDLIYV